MSEYLVQTSTLVGIANAIREKKGINERIPASNFRSEILSIGPIAELYLGTISRASGANVSNMKLTVYYTNENMEVTQTVVSKTNGIVNIEAPKGTIVYVEDPVASFSKCTQVIPGSGVFAITERGFSIAIKE